MNAQTKLKTAIANVNAQEAAEQIADDISQALAPQQDIADRIAEAQKQPTSQLIGVISTLEGSVIDRTRRLDELKASATILTEDLDAQFKVRSTGRMEQIAAINKAEDLERQEVEAKVAEINSSTAENVEALERMISMSEAALDAGSKGAK